MYENLYNMLNDAGYLDNYVEKCRTVQIVYTKIWKYAERHRLSIDLSKAHAEWCRLTRLELQILWLHISITFQIVEVL